MLPEVLLEFTESQLKRTEERQRNDKELDGKLWENEPTHK